jgi:hypothetical protein
MPLTPKQKAAFDKWAAVDRAAKDAKARGDWAVAEADYRAEMRLTYCPFRSDDWVEVGLMREYQGKRAEAFLAYQKGFGIGSHRGPCVGGGDTAEAATRCGLMCEERGLHADACECYYTARRSGIGDMTMAMTLDPAKTSPTAARRLLAILLRDAQKRNGAADRRPD